MKNLTFVLVTTPIIHAMWTCSNCGSPNTVSPDEGCTNCDY